MAAVASATDPTSSNTVYVRNLNERTKIPTLVESLREIFSEYGTILDIVAKSNLRAKGQAFVVFEDASSAQSAIDEIQGFDLFDKPMELAFAKTRSDATVRAADPPDAFEAHRRHRLAEKERKQAAEMALKDKEHAQLPGGLKRAPPPGDAATPADAQKPAKTARGSGLKSTGAGGGVVPDEYLPPNKILFVRELPDDADVDSLTTVFARFEGFKEVRLVPGRKGIAFVEYEAEPGAISAKEGTAGMVLGGAGKAIRVTFQRQ